MTLRAVLYDANGHDREIDLTADQPRLSDARLLWIDLDERDIDDLSAAGMKTRRFRPTRTISSRLVGVAPGIDT